MSDINNTYSYKLRVKKFKYKYIYIALLFINHFKRNSVLLIIFPYNAYPFRKEKIYI